MISAGLDFNIIETTADYILFECTQHAFGQSGAILLIDYDKKVSSSEAGFEIYAYEKFYISMKPVLTDQNEFEVSNFMWELSESDVDGLSVPWFRVVNESCRRSFPIPLSGCKSRVYIKIVWTGIKTSITSDLKLHILNNN